MEKPYITELDTSILESFTAAVLCTLAVSHSRIRGRGASEGTSVRSLGNTTNATPSRGQSLDGSGEGRCVAGRAGRRGRLVAVVNDVAARERGQLGTVEADALVDNSRVDPTGVRCILIDVRNEDLALGDVAIHVVAVVDSILQHSDVPAGQEVSVESEARGFTSGQDVSAVAPVVVLVSGNDHLVEDADGVYWVGRRAGTTVVVGSWVCHMRLVVWHVQVDAIPALREEDLVTDTVLASINIGEVDVLSLSICRVVGGSATVVCSRTRCRFIGTSVREDTHRDRRS